MRKAILKGTTRKTSIHIVLFRIALTSHCIIFSVEFLACHKLEPFILAILKTGTLSIF